MSPRFCNRPLIVHAEIRLQIYGFLLLTVQSVSLASRTPYNHLSPVLNVEHREKRPGGMKPSTVSVSWSSCELVPFRTYSTILSTCKAIHDEATSLLYEKNVFCFDVPNNAKNEAALASSISEQCDNVFNYKDGDWHEKGPQLLKDSAFACFLNRIGARNAASLKAIKFHAQDGNVGRYQFHVVGKLLQRHVRNVQSIMINVHDMRVYTISKINGAASMWIRVDTGEDLKQLCRALTELVRGCPSLEDFDCVGSGFPDRLKLSSDMVKDLGSQDKSQHLYLQEAMSIVKERKQRKKDQLRMTREKGSEGMEKDII